MTVRDDAADLKKKRKRKKKRKKGKSKILQEGRQAETRRTEVGTWAKV